VGILPRRLVSLTDASGASDKDSTRLVEDNALGDAAVRVRPLGTWLSVKEVDRIGNRVDVICCDEMSGVPKSRRLRPLVRDHADWLKSSERYTIATDL